MSDFRWTNPSQPQTLQNAVFIFYFRGVLGLLLGGALGSGLGLLIVAGEIGAGFGIANEKRWGYVLAIVTAGFAVAFDVYAIGFAGLAAARSVMFIISVMIDVALLALVLHPQSRNYQKIWFR